MLFYVSGSALGLHLKFAHAHAAVTTAPTDAHAHHDEHPVPTGPTKQDCPICDMLAGVTKPLAIVAPQQPLFTLTVTRIEHTPHRVCVYHFTTPDISRRGPPPAA